MADENAVLMYKGHPLMRKDNLIYYGSMADSHIVMLQVLETKKVNDLDDEWLGVFSLAWAFIFAILVGDSPQREVA